MEKLYCFNNCQMTLHLLLSWGWALFLDRAHAWRKQLQFFSLVGFDRDSLHPIGSWQPRWRKYCPIKAFLFFIWYTLKMSCYLSTALNNIDKNIEIQIIWPNSFSYWVSNKHSLFCNYCYKIARFIFTWEYECLVLCRLPSWY